MYFIKIEGVGVDAEVVKNEKRNRKFGKTVGWCCLSLCVWLAIWLFPTVAMAETHEQSVLQTYPIIRNGGTNLKRDADRLRREALDWNLWKQESGSLASKLLFAKPDKSNVQSVRLTNPYNGKLTPHGAILVAYHRGANDSWCTFTLSGYCHIGIFNRKLYVNETSLSIRSSNTENGMLLETPRYWRHFQEVREMEVWPASIAKREMAVKLAMGYKGPYKLGIKQSSGDWYCSKVVYRAYFDAAGIDLDEDGGIFVFPGDIRWSSFTKTLRVYAS